MKWIFCLLLALYVPSAFAQKLKLNFVEADLQSKKAAYQQGNSETIKEVKFVLDNAKSFLEFKPQSVTEKNFVPASGTKHDYMSMGPYWWPDPTKKDGLPYIRKDGEFNPEIKKITDHVYLSKLISKCEFLALAYYFTNDEKYADKATELLKVWFLDSTTKMNPNLNFGQAIPGITEGRGIGIIETRSLANLTDWITLLSGSVSYTPEIDKGIRNWYKDYLNWLLKSKNGIDEQHAENNHGTHYDVQIVAFAVFIGDLELAKSTINQSKKRFEIQLEPDGKQPLELARTRAYGYSTMNLDGWFNLAQLGERVGIDLWHYQTSDGRNIQKALDWLIPFAFDEKPKTYKQIEPYHVEEIYRLLLIADKKYPNHNYLNKANSISISKKLLKDNLLNRSLN
jgi:hypothetical protein